MADENNQSMATPASAPPSPPASFDERPATAFDSVASETSDKAASAAQSLKDGASKLAREATDRARDYVAEGKNRAGSALDEMSKLMGDAATTVDDKLGAQYGQYARSAAEGIASFSESLKGKEIEDLMADAQGFVRKSPAVAIGIAAALGFVVARLVKAGLDAADGIADGDVTAAATKPSAAGSSGMGAATTPANPIDA